MSSTIFLLLVLFQAKHFFADYPLQTKYMLGKFKERPEDWVLPLTAHCLVHAVFTFLILIHFVGPRLAWWGASVDGVSHFIMDRIKASPKMLGRFKPLTAETYGGATEEQVRSNKYYWVSLGFDQLVHNLVYCVIIWWVMSRLY
jgi:hypothetical protein